MPVLAEDTDTADSKISFKDQIRPLFNQHCTACHGGVKQAADISFAYRDQVVAPEGWAVEPGDVEASILIDRILSDDPDEVMPPPEHGPPLSEEEVDLLKRWIEQGAQWEEHWAYVKPQAPTVPNVDESDWCRDPIDHFVLQRLEQESVSPSTDAKPERWLRRVTLDLTGLPPTEEERVDFLKTLSDSGDLAYEAVVDRLLASPRYGERWASVWLDQVRYADSKGLGADGRRNVWKYRDWVIDAFNDDMPFDEFTRQQI
ncbi:MAG: DUF1549 domain-containing protein, partial [Planctomycetota bacterium]